MKIEHFYYDEQEKWFAQMKAAMKKHDAELSKEERTLEQKKSDMELQNIIQNAEREEKQTYRIVNTEKYCWFKNITKRVIQFAQLSGCNIKIETLPSMDAVIKMQTGCIWLLSDGETAQQDKRVIQELIDQAEHVYIGNSEREGKKVLDIGDGTVDLLVIRNGKPDLSVRVSERSGMAVLRSEISNRIQQNYGIHLDSSDVEQVLMGEETILEEEIIKEIYRMADDWVHMIINKLHAHVTDFRTNPAIFLGGGSLLLKKQIEQSPEFKYIEFIDDVKANAIGYEKLAAARIRRG